MKNLYESPAVRLSDELGFIVSTRLCGMSAQGFFEGGAGTYGDGTINDYGNDCFE